MGSSHKFSTSSKSSIQKFPLLSQQASRNTFANRTSELINSTNLQRFSDMRPTLHAGTTGNNWQGARKFFAFFAGKIFTPVWQVVSVELDTQDS
jgi:hypothetical protein